MTSNDQQRLAVIILDHNDALCSIDSCLRHQFSMAREPAASYSEEMDRGSLPCSRTRSTKNDDPVFVALPYRGGWLVSATNPLFLYTYALNSNIVIHGPRPT